MKNKDELLEEYRKKYVYYNEETLRLAVKTDKDLVKKIIENKEINGLARGYGILALGRLIEIEDFDFIKKQINEDDPYIKESVYMAFSCFHFENKISNSEYQALLKEGLSLHKEKGVISKIKTLLKNME